MKFDKNLLIEDLIDRTREVLNYAQSLSQLSLQELNAKPEPDSWSVLECIEHLNRYAEFYLPEMERRIDAAPKGHRGTSFRSGVIGNYFANLMLPREKVNRMKTLKAMDPAGSTLDRDTLATFVTWQKDLLGMLDASREVDLARTKTAITLSKWIRLRLGDTLRFVVYHNQRHMEQARQVLVRLGEKTAT